MDPFPWADETATASSWTRVTASSGQSDDGQVVPPSCSEVRPDELLSLIHLEAFVKLQHSIAGPVGNSSKLGSTGDNLNSLVIRTGGSFSVRRVPYSSFTHSIDIWDEPVRAPKPFVVVKQPLSGTKDGEGKPDNPKRLHSVLLELRILYHEPIRNHPNIVKLHHFVWDTQDRTDSIAPSLILEYAELGTLADLQSAGRVCLHAILKTQFCLEIARGLQFLHDCGIVHADVKSENMLIFLQPVHSKEANQYVAKVSDFGSAIIEVCPLSGGTCQTPPPGTAPWGAPEVLAQAPLDSLGLRRTDIYSYGLMVWRITCNGRRPYKFAGSAGGPSYFESIEEFECVKSKGDELLRIATYSLVGRGRSDVDIARTRSILERTVRFDVAQRASSFKEIIALLERPPTITHPDTAAVPLRRGDFCIWSTKFPTYMYHLRTAPIGFRSLICAQLSALASHGDERTKARALLALGVCHLQELHPKFSIEAGMQHVTESASLGDAAAQSLLVCLPHPAQTESRSSKNDWLSNAARHGSVNAALQLRLRHPALLDTVISAIKEDTDVLTNGFITSLQDPSETDFMSSSYSLDPRCQTLLSRSDVQAWHRAAYLGCLARYSKVMKLEVEVDCRTSHDETPLHYAAASISTESAKFLLAKGAEINARTDVGATPLHYALLSPCPQTMVKLLLAQGADVDALSSSTLGDQPLRPDWLRLGTGSPLHFAVLFEDLDCVTQLLQHGSNPNLKNANGVTALQYALQARHLSLLNLMVPVAVHDESNLPDIHSLYPFLTGYFLTPLQKLLYWQGDALRALSDVVDLLERYGIGIDNRGMLSWALDSNNAEIADVYIRKLGLDRGSTVQPWRTLQYNHGPDDIATEVYYFNLPTMLAMVANNCSAQVVAAVAKYIRTPLPDWGCMGWSYLTCVANRKSTSITEATTIIDVLLEHGARFDVQDLSGHGPLYNAVANNNHEILDVLSSQDPPIDDVRAALELCIRKSHSRTAATMIFSILRNFPAVLLTPLHDMPPLGEMPSSTVPDSNYLRTLAGAQEFIRNAQINEAIVLEVIQTLKNTGLQGIQALADRIHQCPSPLHKAAESGNLQAAKLMLEQGADLNAHVANQLAHLLGPLPEEVEGWGIVEDPFMQATSAGPTPLDCALGRDWFMTMFLYTGKYQTALRDLFYAGGTCLEEAQYNQRTQEVVGYLRSKGAKTKWELFGVDQPLPSSAFAQNQESRRQKLTNSLTVKPPSDTETRIFKFFEGAIALPVAHMVTSQMPTLTSKVDTTRPAFSTLFTETRGQFEALLKRSNWEHEEERELRRTLDKKFTQFETWGKKNGVEKGAIDPIATYPLNSLVLAAAIRICLMEVTAAVSHVQELLDWNPKPVYFRQRARELVADLRRVIQVLCEEDIDPAELNRRAIEETETRFSMKIEDMRL